MAAKKPKDEAVEPKKPKAKDEETLATAHKRFTAAVEAESVNRKNYIADVDFSSSDDQWPEEIKKLRGKGRPALTINRLNGVIKQIIGDYRQHKLAIKVLPAGDDASEEIADILGGLIRNIEVQSNADMAYTNGLECSSRGGFGYYRILPQYAGDDVFDQDLVIRPIHNPLTVYMDPSARLITREDANWCFVTEMMPREDFKKAYPNASLKGFDASDTASHGWGGNDDVRVAEYFEKVKYTTRLGAFSNGMVMEITDQSEIDALAAIGITLVREREAERTKLIWRKMTYTEVLDTKEYKASLIPIIPVIGEEVNLEGKVRTRSAIFYAKDPQRMFNYWKTAATESVALASKSPWLLTAEQKQGLEDQWDNANTAPSPNLIYNHVDGQPMPQRIDPATVPIGELTLANGSSDDIKATTGMYDASLGARGNETSGKAIIARQQEGDTATYLFIDNLKKAVEYGGRVLLEWIRITYDAERVVRVMSMEGEPGTETINQQKFNPLTGVTEILNSITTGKYDVVISTGPSFASRKQEGVAAMTQLAQAYPPVMQVAGDLVVKNMDFPGSQEIAERMKRAMPPQITTDPDSPEGQQAAAAAQSKQAEDRAMQQKAMQAQMGVEQGKIEAENAKSQATVIKAHAEMARAAAPANQRMMP